MPEQEQQLKKADWAKHIRLEISKLGLKSLQKKGYCQVQQDYQWYYIKVKNGPELYDKNGKQLTREQVKKMLRRMR